MGCERQPRPANQDGQRRRDCTAHAEVEETRTRPRGGRCSPVRMCARDALSVFLCCVSQLQLFRFFLIHGGYGYDSSSVTVGLGFSGTDPYDESAQRRACPTEQRRYWLTGVTSVPH